MTGPPHLHLWLAGRLLNGLFFALLGLLPVLHISATLTGASLPPDRLALALGAIVLAGLPLLGIGLTIGYTLRSKAALAVAQALLDPVSAACGVGAPGRPCRRVGLA